MDFLIRPRTARTLDGLGNPSYGCVTSPSTPSPPAFLPSCRKRQAGEASTCPHPGPSPQAGEGSRGATSRRGRRRDLVDRVQKRLGAGLDAVGRYAAAAIHAGRRCSTCTITSPCASLPTVTLWTLKSLHTTRTPVSFSIARKIASTGPSPQDSVRDDLLAAAAEPQRHLRRAGPCRWSRRRKPATRARAPSASPARPGRRCRRRRSPSSCRPAP